jgi:hypothetical protein
MALIRNATSVLTTMVVLLLALSVSARSSSEKHGFPKEDSTDSTIHAGDLGLSLEVSTRQGVHHSVDEPKKAPSASVVDKGDSTPGLTTVSVRRSAMDAGHDPISHMLIKMPPPHLVFYDYFSGAFGDPHFQVSLLSVGSAVQSVVFNSLILTNCTHSV